MWPFYMINLIGAVVCGAVSALIASSKGRNVVGWFFVGFLAGLIGIIIVAVLPNVKTQRADREYADRERRRLREQLRQERLKNEAFRRYSVSRLDVHDEHLGIDTRSQAALPGNETPGALPPVQEGAMWPLVQASHAMPPKAEVSTAVWYYETDGQSVGPVDERRIQELIRGGTIRKHTLVWTEGFDDWIMAGEVQQFERGWPDV
jgi:hypothetical protein